MLSLSIKGMVDWIVGGVVVEDEEMINGNDKADPCLICLGPRPYQVTCHLRPDRSLSLVFAIPLATLARASRKRHAIVVPLVLITPSFFRHSLPCDHYAFPYLYATWIMDHTRGTWYQAIYPETSVPLVGAFKPPSSSGQEGASKQT